MKHINITNWQGNITDWTKFNYVYGGLDETIADRVNLSIPGTNLRNYFRKSNNLLPLPNISQADFYGLNYKVENGVISVWGTATNSVNLWLYMGTVLPANTRYYVNFFYQGTAEGRIIYNIAKRRNDWTNRIVTNDSQFTFIKDFSMSAICLQFDANKQYNCTFKPMVVYGGVMPTTYEPYGSMVLVENVGKVDLGTLNWSKQTDGAAPYFRASLTDVASSTLNISCSKFETVAWSTLYNSTLDKCCAIYYSQYILVRDNSYETAEAFKTAMSGVYLTYELATPKVTVFGSVDLGSLTYTYQEATNLFYSYPRDSSIPLPKAGGLQSNPMGYVTLSPWAVTTDKVIYPHISSDYFAVGLRDNAYQNNADGLKNALKGKVMLYELASQSSANMLGMVRPSDPASTAIEDSMSLDELLEPANEER